MALLCLVSAVLCAVWFLRPKDPLESLMCFGTVTQEAMARTSRLIGGNQRSMPLLEDR